MKDKKLSWFLFSTLDAAAVEQRLNGLAEKGWELDETEDCRCVFVKRKRTERKDLKYCVLPSVPGRSEDQLRAAIQCQRERGWEGVATINGLDIYRSIPCYEVKYDEQRHQLSGKALLKQLLPIGLGACGLIVGLRQLYEPLWYLNHVSTLLHYTCLPVVVGAVLWLIGLIAKGISSEKGCVPLMWLRSALTLLACIWVWTLVGTLLLDALPLIYALAIFLLATAIVIVCQIHLSRSNRMLCVNVISWVVLGSVLVGIVAPNFVSRTGREIPVLSVPQFDMEAGTREYTEYTSSGSFLVTAAEYGEVWSDNAYLSEEIYICRTSGLAEQVAADLLEQQGQAYVPLWYNEDGSRMIIQDGNIVLKLWIDGIDLQSEEKMEKVRCYLDTVHS